MALRALFPVVEDSDGVVEAHEESSWAEGERDGAVVVQASDCVVFGFGGDESCGVGGGEVDECAGCGI